MVSRYLSIIPLCAILSLLSADSMAQEIPRLTGPRLGIWVTVWEGALSSKKGADDLIDYASEIGLSDLYVQVYRSGEAYYDSHISDRSRYEHILSETGMDTFDYLIKKARLKGIKVHAWVNLLSLAHNKKARILSLLGPGALAVDQHGRTSFSDEKKDGLDGYYMREEQLFLDPSNKKVREHLESLCEEIVTRYPGVSGLHLDYVRYPASVPFIPGSRFLPFGLSYGHGTLSRENFKRDTGLDITTMDLNRSNAGTWDNWRRDQVTKLVRGISEKVRSTRPEIEISGTVVPSIERAYLVTFQDWPEWLDRGYIDHVIVMDYTDDTRLMGFNASSALAVGGKERTFIGIGAFLLKDRPSVLTEQLELSKDLGTAGIVLFSYDAAVAERSALQEILPKIASTERK